MAGSHIEHNHLFAVLYHGPLVPFTGESIMSDSLIRVLGGYLARNALLSQGHQLGWTDGSNHLPGLHRARTTSSKSQTVTMGECHKLDQPPFSVPRRFSSFTYPASRSFYCPLWTSSIVGGGRYVGLDDALMPCAI